MQKDRDYIAKKGFEVVTPQGQVVTSGAITDEVLAQLRSGKLEVRQKPGATNALGLVKLMFPNEYNVYLHSTPSPQLFSQTRRDFSHGCIRVEKPAELAAWVLRDKPDWNVERAQAAMTSGRDNVQVNLTNPIPVLILVRHRGRRSGWHACTFSMTFTATMTNSSRRSRRDIHIQLVGQVPGLPIKTEASGHPGSGPLGRADELR